MTRSDIWGPEGTYTDDAAKQLFPATTRTPTPPSMPSSMPLRRTSISAGGGADRSLVQGPVTETLDNLFRYAGQVTIGAMLVPYRSRHWGLGRARQDIRRILSKDQALHQCSDYITVSSACGAG